MSLPVDKRPPLGWIEHYVLVSSSASTPNSPASGTVTPAARRAASASWRDPRLVIGVAIVAVSVLVGVKLFSGADNTVSVWAVTTDLRSGTTLADGDLQRRDIRFSEDVDADRYVSAESELPVDTTLVRDVGVGELLPRAALGSADERSLVEVPVAAAAEAVPSTVRAGSVVDVWVTPEAASGRSAAESLLVFDDVLVIAVPGSGSALGSSATRQIVVGVDEAGEQDLAAALARATTGAILITKQG